ncbi:hypothetical protein M413DRAFT_70963 [Hebeloma cylindrosporum]|uniref:Peroxidase n=1 Tax=Hebeloma cylindrosporum TaxID=76867 RepID=A0A0C3CEU8_HEBCY|nr:hypothetical protein M413DRAFT_70963 [Hebeloma cylindrosporum h7]
MHTMILARLSFALTFFSTATWAYHWPEPKFDAIEALLYEQSPEPHGVSLTAILNKCVPGPTGEHTAAEWVRFAYHDMATHNAEAGTGGLDASLYYELDRQENVGLGMRVTSFDFVDFPGKYVSRSDIIAIGTVVAVAECGGPTIPLRMGRVDALVAGPAGVPEPQQDLASHTASFRRQGFTQSEMIGLVACGHTFGGVRTPDFPDIVPATADGSQLVVTFDSTPKFDNAIVTEYLAGTTKNPLVVHPNRTVTSDLRIFSSDNNVTMKSISSPQAYSKRCGDLLARMLDSVPKGVQLSEVIKPLPVKLATKNPERKVTMFWENRSGGKCAHNACSAPVVSTNDTTTTLFQRAGMSPQKYRFNTPINVTTSVSKFWFEVDENDGKKPQIYNNGGTGYEIQQDRVLFVPELSTNAFNNNFTVVVAVGFRAVLVFSKIL